MARPGELALILSASEELVLPPPRPPPPKLTAGGRAGRWPGRHVCTWALGGQDRIPELSPCVHGLLTVHMSSLEPWALATPPTVASAPGSVSGSFRAVCHEGNSCGLTVSVRVSLATAHRHCDL